MKVLFVDQTDGHDPQRFYDISKEKFTVIPNGVDSKIYYPGDYSQRNPHLFISASALIKGYTAYPMVFDNLKRHDPDIDLRIYSSQKLHGIDNSSSQNEF